MGSSCVAGSSSSSGSASGNNKVKDNEEDDTVQAKQRLHIPDFLQKYFNEDKAIAELPHKRLEKEEREEERVRLPEEESELQRNLRQIARLDGLLLRREAAGTARLQAAKVDLEAARDKFGKEAEKTQAEKIEILQRLKDRGLMSGTTSVASRRSTKSHCSEISTIEPSGTPGISGSCSSRSLATTEGGELPSSRTRGLHSSLIVQHLEEVELVSTDWSAWTSTAPGDSEAAMLTPSGDQRVPATNITDSDTSTFELTSGTVSPSKQPTSSAGINAARKAAVLPTVEEDNAGLGSIDKETDGFMPLPEEHGVALIDDPYAEDHEAIDALRLIDEQLQKLVPEQEWEAKSIYSLPYHGAASGAGEGSCVVSRPARSVWSRASAESVAPGDPVLCEQFERREAELALVSIDNRLNEIQCDETSCREPPAADKLKQLLLQAAQESSPPDAQSRVLALTGTAPLNLEEDSTALVPVDGASPETSALVLVADPGASYLDSGLLSKARIILSRLENEEGDWVDAFGEAQNSLNQLEVDLHHLESEQSRPGTAAMTGRVPEESSCEPVEGTSQFSERLEDLHSQVASVLERRGIDEDIISRIRSQLRNEDAEAPGDEMMDNANLDLEGLSEHALPDFDIASSSGFEPWHNIREGPNPELLKALDLELPTTDGAWADEDLERLVGSINAHFGDEPTEVSAVVVPNSEHHAQDESDRDDKPS
jgi:hypothetical protein